MSVAPEPRSAEAESLAPARRTAFVWRSRRGLGILLAAIVLLVVAILVVAAVLRGGTKPAPDAVAVTVPVPIEDVPVPADAKLGVILTLGSGATEGSEWNEAAEGAVVARERLALGHTELTLLVEDDHGTARGAEDAARSLIERGVSGIVYASSGDHLAAGLAALSEAKVPVVLPFASLGEELPGVWPLAPTEDELARALQAALDGFEHPLLVNAGAALPAGAAVADELGFTRGSELTSLGTELARRTGSNPLANGAYAGGGAEEPEPVADPADVLVISGHPVVQAGIVHALQASNVSVPVVLTASATSPAFAASLAQQGGSVSSKLRAVGVDADDALALGRDGQGRAMSAFLAAVRQLAENDATMNLNDDGPFLDVAFAADARAHDAVIALARALSAAGTTDPARVAEELSKLRLSASHAIAGPELDFSSPRSSAARATTLSATAQQLGLRPEGGQVADTLVWFSAPVAP